MSTPSTLSASAVDPESGDANTVLTPTQVMRRRMRSHKGFLIGTAILLALILIAAFAPWIAPYSPLETKLVARLLPPVWEPGGRWEYLLGTDHLGRDYLSRLLYGARISLSIGFGAASLGCVIGVTLGVCAGYFGGRVDQAVNYILTCQLALPGLLLTMALVFLIGPSLVVVVCVIGALHWTYYLVVTRSATMQIRRLDYVTAAEAIGSNALQIILYEVLPNVRNQIIVIFTLEIGIAILAEAALSFLGVGIQPPTPSWGLMIAEGKTAMFYRPWLVILPGIAIFLLVIATNLMGDGLRDVTAPEGRN